MKVGKVGEYIDRGSEKVCYTLDGDPTKICTFGPDEEVMVDEHEVLNDLLLLGIPALETELAEIEDENGEFRVALVSDRYDFHHLCDSIDPYDYDAPLKKLHIQNLTSIRQRLEGEGIGIADLQFLFKNSGEVVICDPREIVTGDRSATEHNSQAIEAMILSAKYEN